MINIEKIDNGCMRMRELSHLTQTAIGPKTVGFEDICAIGSIIDDGKTEYDF